MSNINILCVIPARSGSKSFPNKNIIDYHGMPLMAWSVEQAKKSKYNKQMRIIVSTDSKKYAKIAKKYGAEVPFIRPKNISKDTSIDFDFFKHCVDFLQKKQNYKSDIILHLRPTSPTRKTEDIDKCLDLFIKKRSTYSSLRSVTPVKKSPFKMYTIENSTLIPLFNKIKNKEEPYNECRQKLPKTYLHNGYIDIFNTSILEKKTISGNKILPYVMNENEILDIDEPEDLH